MSKLVKLKEIVDFKTGRLDSNCAEENGIYPFFTCSPETLRINSYAFDCEAVLLAGNNANAVFPVKYYSGKFNAYQRTYIITPKDKSKINVKWLYFQIKHVAFELGIRAVGSATKFLTKRILDDYEINLPDLDTQNYIARVLWKLENKIQLNTQINQTLEQIAQVLFKSWFVDFDPVRAKVQALSEGMSLEQAELTAMQAISGKTPEELTALSQTQPDCYAELAETTKAFPCEMVEIDGVEAPKGWEKQHFQKFVKCKMVMHSKVLTGWSKVYLLLKLDLLSQ